MGKIAFFHPISDQYGASRIGALVVGFIAENDECDVFTTGDLSVLQRMLTEAGIESGVTVRKLDYLPIAHRGMFNPLGMIRWIINLCRLGFFLFRNRREYRCVYVNTLALFGILVPARLVRLKAVVHCHEYLKHTLYGRFMRAVVKVFASGVISVSQHVNGYISTGVGKYHVVHNGIPDATYDVENALHIDPNKTNIGFVGRVMPEKGHWFLLRSLNQVSPELRSKLVVHVFGDSPPTRSHLYAEFQEEAKHLGVEQSIEMHGFQSQANLLIKLCNICLVPSIMADPFPTTVLEAMRAGRAVVATNHGGAKEVVAEGENGFLVEPDNDEQLSSVLSAVARREYDLDQLGRNARITYEEGYTISTFRKQFLEVWQKYV